MVTRSRRLEDDIFRFSHKAGTVNWKSDDHKVPKSISSDLHPLERLHLPKVLQFPPNSATYWAPNVIYLNLWSTFLFNPQTPLAGLLQDGWQAAQWQNLFSLMGGKLQQMSNRYVMSA